jgi:hypothetical protein
MKSVDQLHEIFSNRFEVFAPVTAKNTVFWDVAPCSPGIEVQSFGNISFYSFPSPAPFARRKALTRILRGEMDTITGSTELICVPRVGQPWVKCSEL